MSLKNKGFSSPGLDNLEHQPDSHAKKVMDSILAPGLVVTADPSAAPVYVGKGNICRMTFAAKSYVAFGPSTITAPASVTSSPGLEIPATTYVLVGATDDYLIASAAPTRLEVING